MPLAENRLAAMRIMSAAIMPADFPPGTTPKKTAMKKKPLAKDRPQQQQLDAIHHLIDSGRIGEAESRIAGLRRQFPRFKPLLGLAWQAAEAGGKSRHACLLAWDWAQASPNSAAAWNALADSALPNFSALAVLAIRRIEALDGLPARPEPAPLPNPFGPVSFDQAVRMDTCRLLLAAGRLDEADAAIAGIDHASARNNLALVAFARGDIERALAVLEENRLAAPDNLFGLERIIRLRLWRGGREAVAGLAETLAAREPPRGDDLLAKLSGLILLHDFAAADAAWLAAKPEYMDSSRQVRDGSHALAALAAWRLGQKDEALARLAAAGPEGVCADMADELRHCLPTADTPNWQAGELAAWWPLANTHAMKALPDKTEAALELVKPILERDELHVSEWRACLDVQFRAARALGRHAEAARLLEAVDDCERMLAEAG